MKNFLKVGLLTLILFVSANSFAQVSQSETINTTSVTRVELDTYAGSGTTAVLRLIGSDSNVSYTIINSEKGYIDFTISSNSSGSIEYSVEQMFTATQSPWVETQLLTINYNTNPTVTSNTCFVKYSQVVQYQVMSNSTYREIDDGNMSVLDYPTWSSRKSAKEMDPDWSSTTCP